MAAQSDDRRRDHSSEPARRIVSGGRTFQSKSDFYSTVK